MIIVNKILFFLVSFFFFSLQTQASSLQNLEVLNGTLSREFESTNNVYSVLLETGEETLEVKYETVDPNAIVHIYNEKFEVGGENKTLIEVINQDGTKETYTFYLEQETVTPVFDETLLTTNEIEPKEIPFLSVYVGAGCFLLIVLLFKLLVLGFKKKNVK